MEKKTSKASLFILIFIVSFIFPDPVFPQTSFNMTLLKNLAEHSTMGGLSYSALWGYTAPNGREYALLGCYTGTAFVDITDSLNIREVDFLPCPNIGGTYREMKTYSHYAYIVSETPSSSIQVVDLQYLPDSIKYVGMKTFPGYNTTHTISQEGPYLYLNGNNVEFGGHIGVLDLTADPENPIVRGKWNLYGVHDTRILRDTIYAANIGDNLISIIDARDKDNLVTIRSFPTTPIIHPHNCAVTNDRKYMYSTDETIDGKLKIWDIHDIHDPILLGRYTPSGFRYATIHNVEISGNYAILAYYSAGVQVLDITNPANPVLSGFYDTYPDNNNGEFDGCWAVYRFASGKIIASDRKYGLFVMKLIPPTNAIPVANFIADSTVILPGVRVGFLDISSGVPTSRNWTITGPENFNSTIINPEFIFYQPGTYTVKLRVSNSLGADSITKVNYVTVNVPPFIPFNFAMQPFTVNTSPTDTSRITFIWRKTGPSWLFTYKLSIKEAFGNDEVSFPSGNNGIDTTLLLRKSYLDSLGRQFGYSYDSIICRARVHAYRGTDSSFSGNILLFTIRTSVVGVNNISTEIPSQYMLYNNYPNPFNPETKIKFEIPQSDFVNLSVYDLNGRLIEELVNEKISAGTYEVIFSPKNLSSGIYFYHLKTSKFTETKKMIIIK